MAVDLHTHSNASDGTDPPADVITMAADAGLTAIALTDHDGFAGHPEAVEAAAGRIELVCGVEISTAWGNSPVHLVGYWLGPDSPLGEALVEVRKQRAERNLRILDALADLDIEITADQLARVAGQGTAGRPHIASILVERGVVESINQAFTDYLARGRPAYRERPRMGLAQAIELVHRSGGVCAVAHPHTIADPAVEYSEFFAEFARLGADGVETHCADHPPHMRGAMADKAEAAGLVATGGSDYHGQNKPGIAVGTGRGDLAVPDRALDGLRKRLL